MLVVGYFTCVSVPTVSGT